MRPFLKTLFGDARNIAAVAIIVAVGGVAVRAGHPDWAVIAMPVTALLAVAWLARQ
jgi:type IV secretory pathway VirB2 component (pilin)